MFGLLQTNPLIVIIQLSKLGIDCNPLISPFMPLVRGLWEVRFKANNLI